MRLEIVAPAYKIDDKTIRRFCDMNNKADLLIVTDREMDLPDGCHVIIYPFDENPFNFCRTMNYGIRRSDGDVILSASIDHAFSPQAIEAAKTAEGDQAIGFHLEWIKSAYEIVSYKWSRRQEPTGAMRFDMMMAATPQAWAEIRGFNERCRGWGWAAIDMMQRASKVLNVQEAKDCPAFSFRNSPTRSVENGWSVGGSNGRNKRICLEAAWHEVKESERWGLEKTNGRCGWHKIGRYQDGSGRPRTRQSRLGCLGS